MLSQSFAYPKSGPRGTNPFRGAALSGGSAMIRRPRLLVAGRLAGRWLPFLAGMVVFAGAGLAGKLPLSLGSVAWAGGLWALWLLGKGLWPQALGFALLLSPLGWDAWVAAPRLESELRAAPGGSYLRVSGIVRDWHRGPPGLSYRLGRVTLELNGAERHLAELEIERLPGAPDWKARRRTIHFGGTLAGIGRSGAGLALTLNRPAWHVEADPIRPGGGERLRQSLADRAGYYLSRRALAVYLPIVLDVREKDSPEAREVTQAFNRVGVAHLFAISGLNVTMMYLLLLPLVRGVTGLFLRRQGWAHTGAAACLAITLLLWAYMGLIGFPAPAVRAAAMGTMIVWSQLWGTRPSPLYVLALAAALMLAWDPSQIHDLSFQLSFMAYAFLLLAASLWELRPPPAEQGTLAARIVSGAALNLLVTLVVTAGLWPVISSAFERFSLLVFAGNLLLVPLMGVAILPLGLAAFLASLIGLGAPPETLLEQLTYGLLDAALLAWAGLVRALDEAGRAWVFHFRVAWAPGTWFLYYAGVLLLFAAIHAILRRAQRTAPRRSASP